MSLFSYVNGRFYPHEHARVHIEDRGYQFADGVYEVIACYDGVLIDMEKHCIRLQRSLDGLAIHKTVSERSLTLLIHELLRRNGYNNAYVYLQITRGVAKRNHSFPSSSVTPSLVITANHAPMIDQKTLIAPKMAVTHPDLRWKQCDIKSISLLPNAIAKQYAVEHDAIETILVNKDGYITEGSASNMFIVTKDNVLVTHPATSAILGGITRDNIISLAKHHGIHVDERPIAVNELKDAKEAFITSTTKDILPLSQIDDIRIGNGKDGETTHTLYTLYKNHIKNQILL